MRGMARLSTNPLAIILNVILGIRQLILQIWRNFTEFRPFHQFHLTVYALVVDHEMAFIFDLRGLMISGISGASGTSPISTNDQSRMPSTATKPSTGYTPANLALERSTAGPNNTDQMSMPHQQSGALSDAQQGKDTSELQGLLEQLLNLLTQLMEQLESSGGGSGAVTPDGGGSLKPESGSGNIPAPTEHVQTINLGGKQITIGGDGTASAQEVQQAAQTMQNMYQTSPSFRQQIDSNPNASLEVSIGRRGDNTSWGSTDGRVFLNINNVSPTGNDTFQSLVAHEVAHTQGIGHGSGIEALEDAAAAQA